MDIRKKGVPVFLFTIASLATMAFNMVPVLANEKLEVSPVNFIAEEKEIEPEVEYIHYYGTDEQLSKVVKHRVPFIKKIALQASESALENDLYASVTIAQAILESGWGESGLSARNNNLFGIKGSYKGNSVNISTQEDDGSGNKYKIRANFRAYPSWDESIADHDYLLRHGLNGFYKGAWKSNTNNYKDATRFLEGRYATDTSYASALNRLIETYNLTRFDKKQTKEDIEWLKSDSTDPFEKVETVFRMPTLEEVTHELTWGSTSRQVINQFENEEKASMQDVNLHEFTDAYFVNMEKQTGTPLLGSVVANEYLDKEGNPYYEYSYVRSINKSGDLLVAELHNNRRHYRVIPAYTPGIHYYVLTKRAN